MSQNTERKISKPFAPTTERALCSRIAGLIRLAWQRDGARLISVARNATTRQFDIIAKRQEPVRCAGYQNDSSGIIQITICRY
jgi:hypothetical protein